MKENKEELKKEKLPKEKKAKKEKKDKKPNKFIETIKKKWLINGTKTIILVLLIMAIFLAINVWVQSLNLNPIDLSQDKLYTLTDDSKEKVKNIDKDVNIYFVGYEDDNADLSLAKQYTNENEKIKVEAVTAESRPDLVEKYGIDNDSSGIIVACGNRSKVLTSNDLVTYDSTTYETISIAEEKLTSAIMSVTADEVPKVYFLEGYSDYTLSNGMSYLNIYLQNEITQVDTLNILSQGKVPDDCNALVIPSPSKDFDDVATKAITDYINNGGNILWLNERKIENTDLTNVNKILAMYGVNPFEVGAIRETDTSKMVSGSQDLIMPELGNSKITEDLYSNGIIFINATKINIDEEKLTDLKVTKKDLATTSEGSYFRSDFTNAANEATDQDQKGPFVVGAELEKTITEANEETGEAAKTSKLVIFGENMFTSDQQVSQNSQYATIQLAYNKDLVLNSIAYLADREEDITARKSTGTVTYTATEQQDTIVRIIIFAVPVVIIAIGLIVWQVRRRKK